MKSVMLNEMFVESCAMWSSSFPFVFPVPGYPLNFQVWYRPGAVFIVNESVTVTKLTVLSHENQSSLCTGTPSPVISVTKVTFSKQQVSKPCAHARVCVLFSLNVPADHLFILMKCWMLIMIFPRYHYSVHTHHHQIPLKSLVLINIWWCIQHTAWFCMVNCTSYN